MTKFSSIDVLRRNAGGILIVLLIAGCAGSSSAPQEPASIRDGRAIYDRGELDRARQHFTAVLAEAEASGDALLRGMAMKWLGNVELATTQDDAALRFYRRSAALFDSLAAQGSSGARWEGRNVRNNIAVVHLRRGEYAQADSLYRFVLEGDRKAHDRTGTAISLYNLGIVRTQKARLAYETGDSSRFRSLLSESRDLFHSSLSAQETGDAWLNLGNAHAYAGNLDSAVIAFRQAETRYRASGYKVQQCLCLGNIGVLLSRMQRAEEALDALRAGVAILEQLRGDLGSIDVRSSFVSNKFYMYEAVIEVLVGLGRVDEAFDYVERAKARSFLDLIGNKAIGEYKARDPEVQALIDEERQVQDRVARLLGLPDSARVLLPVMKRHQELLAELQRRDPEYASVKSIEPVSMDTLQSLLPAGTGLLEYFLGDQTAFVFLVKKDTVIARALRFPKGVTLESRIEELRRKFYNAFPAARSAALREARLVKRLSPEEAQRQWQATVTNGSWQYDAVQVYSLILSPLEEALRGLSALYIVPHGPLHHVPFQALIAPTDIDRRSDVHIPRPRYLIERFTLAFLPGASALAFAVRRDGAIPREGVVVGDPAYADPVYRKKPLEGALIEADSVAHFLERPTVLKREDATEARVVAAMRNAALIHLATHGELNKKDPLRSRILFAVGSPASSEDGNLTVAEVFNLDLRAALVTLSACQTAQIATEEGRFTPGDDVVGLTRGFLYAGTPAVVASLWYVDDAATLEWMRLFYHAWLVEGRSRAAAARQASLRMLEHPEDPDWIFPYYWSAFILFGAM